MRTIDLRGAPHSERELRELVPRAALGASGAAEKVRPLVNAVRDEGERALRAQAATFDRVEGHLLRVPEADVAASLESCPPEVRSALESLASRLRLGSAVQVPGEQVTTIADGAKIRQRWQPVARVGLYAPGGKAAYPSSVLMNAIAAQVAGVGSLALASPAQAEHDGLPHPSVLWAAALAGITEVYAIGGAGAIAAFAYGVPEIAMEPVDVVTGPGNVFVAAAKRLVQGVVGIDAEAGTTEILIIADDSANSRVVAADLISQAEHDEAAASILVTSSPRLIVEVEEELTRQVAKTRHQERVRTALAGEQSALMLVDTIDDAVRVSNAYAPEHLEIQTSNASEVAVHTTNAGAIFVGDFSPVSLGDYLAGSNHVLPTGGTARFAAGLGAHTFLRPQQVVTYESAALRNVAEPLGALARTEGLPAHGDAVTVRFEGESR